MEEKKTWRELPVPMDNDIYYPILYLLYKKDILSEAELIKWIETRSYLQSFHDILDSVDKMVGDSQ